MIPQEMRDHCTHEEFLNKCKKYMEVGDTITEEEWDGDGAVVVFRNSAKCLLACWIVETQEYREF